jgi:hypothetical protein
MVPGPDWWAKPVAAADLVSLVPPGRRFDVWHTGPAGRIHVWYFPEAAGDAVWTDDQFASIDPPDNVREHVERLESATSHSAAATEKE